MKARHVIGNAIAAALGALVLAGALYILDDIVTYGF